MNRSVDVDESVSDVITRVVSESEECPTIDLPPLFETVDVEALNSLICSETTEIPQFDGCVMFEYSNSHVAIWNDRSISVTVV